MGKRKYLKRRYGFSLAPLIAINGILLITEFVRLSKFGISSVFPLDLSYLVVVLMINLIPLYIIYGVWCYRIGTDGSAIWARPFTRCGPYLYMRFDDIDLVDIKALTELGNISNALLNPAVIVLYRKGWDSEELFALDPRRTNLKQFKELVLLIRQRRPETFTENARRFADGTMLETPRSDSQGNFIWGDCA